MQLLGVVLKPRHLALSVQALRRFQKWARLHPFALVRIIREGAESGVWGDEIAPKMIVAA